MNHNYKGLLPYCSNLDDSEYNSLWKYYEEESLFKRSVRSLTNKIGYLIWTIRMKIYLMRN